MSARANTVELPVPAACAALDAADVRAIALHGPYTEDPALTLLPALQWDTVCHTLRTFVVRTSARLLNYAHAVGAPPAALTSREITSALLSRPSINPGGKTHMNFLPVLPSTDTKSYEDMIKIVHHAQAHVGRPLVLVVRGDGQTVLERSRCGDIPTARSTDEGGPTRKGTRCSSSRSQP